MSVSNDEPPIPENGEEFEGGGGGLDEGGLCSFGALNGISTSSISPCTDIIGADSGDVDTLDDFRTVDVEAGFVSEGLECDRICSR